MLSSLSLSNGSPCSAPSVSFIESALDELEHEAIYILREGLGQLNRTALLFSGGKDSVVLTHLLARAVYPAPLPCPLLHIDTGHNFPETLAFRDRFARQMGATVWVRKVQDSIDSGLVHEEKGDRPSRNAAQTVTLLEAVRELQLDGLFGGARRDEEKARAKERFFSHRDQHGQWNPRSQRPECWSLMNSFRSPGEHFRVFPLSNWTELDIWRYIRRHELELPSLYFAHPREVVATQNGLLAACAWVQPRPGETMETCSVRFRTVGDMTCTGAVRSQARTLDQVLEEVAFSKQSERSSRQDDRRSDTAMEQRKRYGYF